MDRNSPIKRPASPWFLLVCLAAFGTAQARGQYDPDWARNFRLGLLVGFNIKADFRTTGSFSLPGRDPGFYDDGYVLVDDSGNARNYTTFWGYENASQYDDATGTLLMHSTSGYTIEDARSNGRDDAPYVGFDLAYGGTVWRGQRLRAGWELGFGLLPIKISDNRLLNTTLNQVVHSYEVPPGVMLPGAPYHGSASGIGQPAIFDIASPAAGGITNGTASGSRTLDVTLYALRLGPTLFWDVHPRVGLSVSAGPALGFLTGTYKFNEVVGTGGSARNKERFSDSDLVYGGYVSATVTYHAVKNGDFYLGVQYMPLGESTFNRGGREATLDLSGAIYLSAGINWPF